MKTTEHPEVQDINNICTISPHTRLTNDVCSKIKNEKPSHLKIKARRIKKNEKLDQALKDTFPASDATAQYK